MLPVSSLVSAVCSESHLACSLLRGYVYVVVLVYFSHHYNSLLGFSVFIQVTIYGICRIRPVHCRAHEVHVVECNERIGEKSFDVLVEIEIQTEVCLAVHITLRSFSAVGHRYIYVVGM